MASEYFYQGNKYGLEPEYGELFSGYRMSASGLGQATDPRTANQLQEVSNKLNFGGKVIEISIVQPNIFDAIPKQHLKEISRISKLTGAELTLHGPLIEASGFDKQGWTEANRQQAENEMLQVIERGHEINPKGNLNITFHSAAALPEAVEKMRIGKEERTKSMLIADSRTGEINVIREKERYFPEKGYKVIEEGKPAPLFDPKQELDKKNEESWRSTLSDLNFYAMRGSEVLEQVGNIKDKEGKSIGTDKVLKLYSDAQKNPKIIEQLPAEAKQIVQQVSRNIDHAEPYLRDSYIKMRELYNRVYKESSGEDRNKLDSFRKEIAPLVEQGFEKDPMKLQQFAEKIEGGLKMLGDIESPKLFVPLNNFLIEKSATTFGDVAFNAYQKFKDSTPVISIENPPVGTALSRAEDLKELIERSRKKFVENAVKKGMDAGSAENAAKKIIGATWDVGHINMIRKYGYDAADVVKETEKIAPYVKHVHLSDNFGYEHTELPMGMGNVPTKEIFETLEKQGKLGQIKKIIETGDWFQHFKTAPTAYLMEAFGSPLGGGGGGYWNQARGLSGNYYGGFGTMLPDQHFSMYGSGFSSLPTELGGQIAGRSRSTGTPMD